MESTIIEFLFSTLSTLASQYPDAAWVGTAVAVLLSICGVCSVLTIWLPVPSKTTGVYAIVYRVVHGFAAHFKQNKGAVADGNSEAVKSEVNAVTGKTAESAK